MTNLQGLTMKRIQFCAILAIMGVGSMLNITQAQQANYLNPDHFSFEDGGAAVYYQPNPNDYWSISTDRAAGSGLYSLRWSGTAPITETQKAKTKTGEFAINLPTGDYTIKMKVWLASGADIPAFVFILREPWKSWTIQVDTILREQWVEISFPVTFTEAYIGASMMIKLDPVHIGNGTMYIDDIEIWGEKEPEPQFLPQISSVETSDSAHLSLLPGVYDVQMMFWKDPGTTISTFHSTISEPWVSLQWDVDTVTEGQWSQLSQEFVLEDTALNAKITLQVINDPQYGGGKGSIYIDDLEFIRKAEFIPVSDISLLENEITLNKGELHQLEYNLLPIDATDTAVLWISGDAGIASVSTDGLVSANAGGETTISVFSNDGSFVARCNVTVIVPVTGVSLSDSDIELKVGESYQLFDTIHPFDASNIEVEWNSDNSSVAAVDDGLVTAISKGIALITASTLDGNFTAQCQVTVSIAVEGVTLSDTEITIDAGDQYQLTETVDPADASNKEVEWSSDAASIASVSDGLVTGHAPGISVITVTTQDGDFSDQCQVTVLDTTTNVKQQKLESFALWPNPFTTELNIVPGHDDEVFELYSLSGVMLMKKRIHGPEKILLSPGYDLLPQGMYILKIHGKSSSKSIQVTRQ